jgi:hypothetical protein
MMYSMRRRPPTTRPEVFKLYWYFASERHRIFERRVSGDVGPWTKDPILQTYKFCNVFRASDRVSQYLIRSVAYHEEQSSETDRVFQVVAFRTFSSVRTWRSVCSYLGHQPLIRDLATDRFIKALEHARATNNRLYTGAFILCATNAYGQSSKHLNHVELFRDMFLRKRLAERILKARSLKAVYDSLHEFPLMGDFMSYQTAIDLNYSALVNFSEDDFTQPGPGALRGMKKVFVDLGDYSPADVVKWIVDRQEDEFAARKIPPASLWGRGLHAIDAQGLFCETDKYCREALPALQSNRSRIKARFVAAAEPIKLFYPPKWGLNERVPEMPVLGMATAGSAKQKPPAAEELGLFSFVGTD